MGCYENNDQAYRDQEIKHKNDERRFRSQEHIQSLSNHTEQRLVCRIDKQLVAPSARNEDATLADLLAIPDNHHRLPNPKRTRGLSQYSLACGNAEYTVARPIQAIHILTPFLSRHVNSLRRAK